MSLSRIIQERADEILLADVFERQRQLHEGYSDLAQLLYRLRALWIGGMCLPWDILTEGQRQGYIKEVKALVTKAKGEL